MSISRARTFNYIALVWGSIHCESKTEKQDLQAGETWWQNSYSTSTLYRIYRLIQPLWKIHGIMESPCGAMALRMRLKLLIPNTLVFSFDLVVTPGYLIVTSGYFSLLQVPRFSSNDSSLFFLLSPNNITLINRTHYKIIDSSITLQETFSSVWKW